MFGALSAWYTLVLGWREATVTVKEHRVIPEDRRDDGWFAIIHLDAQSPNDRQFQLPKSHEDYPGTGLIVTKAQYDWIHAKYPPGAKFTITYSPWKLPGRQKIPYKDALFDHLESVGMPNLGN